MLIDLNSSIIGERFAKFKISKISKVNSEPVLILDSTFADFFINNGRKNTGKIARAVILSC